MSINSKIKFTGRYFLVTSPSTVIPERLPIKNICEISSHIFLYRFIASIIITIIRQTENCPIDRQDSFPDTDRKLSGNKKEIKKNHLTIRGSKEPRSPYGTFQNVFLSETELENIRQTIPDWQDYMERLSGYMASTGKQYQNHAATIIRWARQDHPVSRQRNYESEEYETL